MSDEITSPYYRDQLNKVKIDPEFGVIVKIQSANDTQTNWLNLNRKSIAEIRKWLDENEDRLVAVWDKERLKGWDQERLD